MPPPRQPVQDERAVRAHARERAAEAQDALRRPDRARRRRPLLRGGTPPRAEEHADLVDERAARRLEHAQREGVVVLERGGEDEGRERGEALLAWEGRVWRMGRWFFVFFWRRAGRVRSSRSRIRKMDDCEQLEHVVNAEALQDTILEAFRSVAFLPRKEKCHRPLRSMILTGNAPQPIEAGLA